VFNRLIASGKRRMSWVRNPWVIVASVGVHAFLLGGLLWAAGREGPPPPERPPEELTFIDITQLPPPPEEIFETPPPEAEAPAPAAAAPAAPQQAAAPRPPAVPRTQPTTPQTEQPAGFQELRVPDPPAGIPAPDISAPAVSADDFGGRGAVGGVAGGTPVPAPPGPRGTGGTGTGAGTGTGSGTGSGTGGTGTGPPTGTFTANLVDRPAELTNAAEVARTMRSLYPQNLRHTGVTGRAVVEMVVSAEGRVEPGSARLISSSHPGFADVSLRAVESFRFRPARVGPHAVRMRVQIPITWRLDS
jgi:TonB family protein